MAAASQAANAEVLGGIVPYLELNGASEAAAFYDQGFRRMRGLSCSRR